jgi:hypothetical protein
MKKGSYVYRDGKEKPVKNLGWLLRHWKEIEYFEVGNVILSDNTTSHALRAVGTNWIYETDYASLSVLHSWLNRPTFKGLIVNWLFDTKVEIGSNEYKSLPIESYRLTSW